MKQSPSISIVRIRHNGQDFPASPCPSLIHRISASLCLWWNPGVIFRDRIAVRIINRSGLLISFLSLPSKFSFNRLHRNATRLYYTRSDIKITNNTLLDVDINFNFELPSFFRFKHRRYFFALRNVTRLNAKVIEQAYVLWSLHLTRYISSGLFAYERLSLSPS